MFCEITKHKIFHPSTSREVAVLFVKICPKQTHVRFITISVWMLKPETAPSILFTVHKKCINLSTVCVLTFNIMQHLHGFFLACLLPHYSCIYFTSVQQSCEMPIFYKCTAELRSGFVLIWIRIQHFKWIRVRIWIRIQSRSRVLMTKNGRKKIRQKCLFFW